MTTLPIDDEAIDPPISDAWSEERANLEHVIEDIDRGLANIDKGSPATAAYQETAEVLQGRADDKRRVLEKARPNPYVGRADLVYTDLRESDRPRQTIYIGVDYSFGTSIPNTEIVSFAAPVARLFYNPTLERITVGGREMAVLATMKRTITVRNGEIIRLSEDLRRSVSTIEATVPNVGTDSLTNVLGQAKSDGGHLEIIIGTIEPDQYERIANVSDQVLVVQGAAGSGKSEIGLHRIAYLLSPFSDIGDHERPTPDSVLFIGPSRSFLEYVSDVLPQLGVTQGVRQTTFPEWVSSVSPTRLNIQPRFWNNLLDRGEPTLFDSDTEAFKGSMAMADAMSRYVNELTRNTRATLAAMPATRLRLNGHTVTVSKKELQEIGRQALAASDAPLPLNQRRSQFIQTLANRVIQRSGAGRRPTVDERRRLVRSVANQLEEKGLNEAWPSRDFRQTYAEILSEPERLVRLTKGQVTHQQAERLRLNATKVRDRGFEDSDRAPLHYLDHLINGTIAPRYTHIVVDEAQDLSPLDFALLRLASTNGWFTILGDTSQKLMPHRGVGRWRELQRVLGRDLTTVQEARRAFRATKQITGFNNRILRLFDSQINAPVPYERDGHRVELVNHRSRESMFGEVSRELQRIRTLERMEDAQVGILVRDLNTLNAFWQFCRQNEDGEIERFGEEGLSARTVLARIPDTKGLEYDAVIILGVNETFRSTNFNRKLLYLACTRAKHYLALHHYSKRSPILQEISTRGIAERRPPPNSSTSWD